MTELFEGLNGNIHAGSAGDIVEDDRGLDTVRDDREVVDQTRLGGLVVVGCYEQQTVCTELFCFQRQLDGIACVIAAGASDDGNAVLCVVDGELDALGRDLVLHRAGRDDAVAVLEGA